jgi:hypothetical protein
MASSMLAECKLEVAMDTDSSKRSVLFVDGVEKMFSLVTDLQLLRA